MNGTNSDSAVLLAGNSLHPADRDTTQKTLVDEVSEILQIPIAEALVGRFNDAEVRVEVGKRVELRKKTVFIMQSTPPPEENWRELFLLADACRRAAAGEIIWVAPNIGYARQDRRMHGHDPISAAQVLKQAVAAGVQQIITLDLHCGQLQGVVDIPFGNLWGRKVMLRHILSSILGIAHDDFDRLSQLAIGAPDPGSFPVAAYYADLFGCYLIPALKRRPRPNVVGQMILLEDEKANGRVCIPLDEMVDTAGTMIEMSRQLKQRGATQVICAATHPVLSGNAIDRIEQSDIDIMVTTNTIRLPRQSPKIQVVSVATELADAMNIVLNGGIVSGLAEQFA
ncbi:MAG: ribose-phosphate diphosphokinase [Patescibacteria group bacterium]